MKGYVYLLLRKEGWEARATIAPEVDEAYWFGRDAETRGRMGTAGQLESDASYCEAAGQRNGMEHCEESGDREVEGQREALKHRVAMEDQKELKHRGAKKQLKITERHEAVEAWLCKEELPWGQACLVADLWNSRQGEYVTGRPGYGRHHPFQQLAKLVAELQERDGRQQGSAISGAARHQLAGRWGERSRGVAVSGETAALAQLAAGLLQGRALLGCEARDLLIGAAGPGAGSSWSGALQLLSLLGQARLAGAVAAGDGGRRAAGGLCCRRCGSDGFSLRRTRCHACGRLCAYCEACLMMGRSRECELFVTCAYVPPDAAVSLSRDSVREAASRYASTGKNWGLSPAQEAAAAQALDFIESKLKQRSARDRSTPGFVAANQTTTSTTSLRPFTRKLISSAQQMLSSVIQKRDDWAHYFLLWAVTGAGKTEMIFPLVETVLGRGGRVLIASPRRDVVIELDPRLRKAFPDTSVVTLYGGSEQRWEQGSITLSTTHQLFRFHQAFDLVVIDELDAFPY
ncbi:DEAD/DEAH box helicase family protein [Paenibacillus sp. CAU 1782]